jgi:hypothetical protein
VVSNRNPSESLTVLPNRHVFARWLFRQAIVHFSVAFSIDESDQSSCAKPAQKGYPTL